MLAAVNPCGFAMLPAYLSLLVIGDDPPPRKVAVGRALAATAAMTAGFATVFGLFGLAIAPAAGQIQEHLPWFTIKRNPARPLSRQRLSERSRPRRCGVVLGLVSTRMDG